MSWKGNYELTPNHPIMVAAHQHIYESGVIGRGYYHGHPIGKYPTDLLMYAEVIHRTRPHHLIETGTNAGGSALWFAHCFDNLDHDAPGTVYTIDPFPREDGKPRPAHGRITYHHNSSLDPALGKGLAYCIDGEPTMVVLDSVHAASHVYEELRLYAPLVTPGCYCVVEDTNLNGHPVAADHGPGPMEAVAAFLETDLGRCFEVDRTCERYGISMSPKGWLRRKC